jgi:mRNA interferase RelE/StbE
VKKIAYSNQARKALLQMPADQSQWIREKIEQYARNPAELANNVKRLKGREGLRLRVGDWRVIFDESADTIEVLVIGPRGSAYG